MDRCRDRIARYCGGFEIHCPLDAGVQIPLSAPILGPYTIPSGSQMRLVVDDHDLGPGTYLDLRAPCPLTHFPVEDPYHIAPRDGRCLRWDELLECDDGC